MTKPTIFSPFLGPLPNALVTAAPLFWVRCYMRVG